MKNDVVNIPLKKLRYDFDEEVGRHWPEFIAAFKVLEKKLPNIPTNLELLVRNYYMKLPEVYESVGIEGLKDPLVVIKVGSLYRVRIGNQRLLSIKAQKKLKVVPCKIMEE